MVKRRVKGKSNIKSVQARISTNLQKEIEKIRKEYRDDMDIDLTFPEASELYRKQNRSGWML